MGIITFNGVGSNTLGVEVERYPDYGYPERDYEAVHVPGRNGDVIFDNGCFRNVDVKYGISAPADADHSFLDKAREIVSWLHSGIGYLRLEDTYDPDYFRLAMYVEQNNFVNIFNKAGAAEITFNCKPQRYLKTGENIATITGNKITNPTVFDAKPLITLTCTARTAGTISINGRTIQVKNTNTSTTIILDSDLEDAYNSLENLNGVISGTFPILEPGENNIAITGGVTAYTIRPRWWTL